MEHQDPHTQTSIRQVRQLWFGSYHGILSTHSTTFSDYPFGSLVPLCRDSDGVPLLLLSHLAQHTKNLDNNPHCSLFLAEQRQTDIQQLKRLTCLATAEQVDSIPPAISERYFRYYPQARIYQETLNFNFYRLKPQRLFFVGGFGTARWFDINRILPACGLSHEDESQFYNNLNSKEITGSLSQIVGIDCLRLDLNLGAVMNG